MSQYKLTFTLMSDWHIGDGRQGGAYADSIALKDSNQLPYIPGKSIRGLLRDAFELAATNQWFGQISSELVELLFGQSDSDGSSSQGCLTVSSATLTKQEQEYLKTTQGATSFLYRVLQSTAINPETGIADDGSLRSIEVTVPMTLCCEVSLNMEHKAITDYPELAQQLQLWLAQTVTLIHELGAKRRRGFGQVQVRVEEE